MNGKLFGIPGSFFFSVRNSPPRRRKVNRKNGERKLDTLDLSCGFFFASFFAFLRVSFTFFLIFARLFVDTRADVSAGYQENTQNVVACIFRAFLRTFPYADHGQRPLQEEGGLDKAGPGGRFKLSSNRDRE